MLQMTSESEAGEHSRARTESQFAPRRLTLADFSAALARVGVRDEEEVASLFAAVCPENRDSISVEELASSMAAVSPALLLEDVRDKLLKKYSTLAKAYDNIDKEHSTKNRTTSHDIAQHRTTNTQHRTQLHKITQKANR